MKEKIDNFFYYYKTHLIVAVFLTVILVIGIRSCADRKVIDLKVVYFSDALTASETADTMEKSFAENGLLADIDGDGEKTFHLDSIVHDFDIDGSVDEATVNKIQATMFAGDHTLMLVHKYALEDYDGSYEDISSHAKEGDGKFISPNSGAVIGISVAGNPYLEKMGIPTDNLYVAMRLRTESEIKKGKNKNHFDHAYKVMDYILSQNGVRD